jgi:regulator of protease activity HflC (stomatin/prohibitin superfamily)
MPPLLEWLSSLLSQWKAWIVVPPWDVGLRVRLGKNAVALGPGIHFRIPFIDDITLINTRMRIVGTPPVTIDGEGNRVRMIKASVGMRIVDPLKAMMQFSDPHSVLQSRAQALLADEPTAQACRDQLRQIFEPYGIEIDFVSFVENVHARALRLMQEQWGPQSSELATANQKRY